MNTLLSVVKRAGGRTPSQSGEVSPASGPTPRGARGMVPCPRCTLENEPGSTQCAACGGMLPEPKPKELKLPAGSWNSKGPRPPAGKRPTAPETRTTPAALEAAILKEKEKTEKAMAEKARLKAQGLPTPSTSHALAQPTPTVNSRRGRGGFFSRFAWFDKKQMEPDVKVEPDLVLEGFKAKLQGLLEECEQIKRAFELYASRFVDMSGSADAVADNMRELSLLQQQQQQALGGGESPMTTPSGKGKEGDQTEKFLGLFTHAHSNLSYAADFIFKQQFVPDIVQYIDQWVEASKQVWREVQRTEAARHKFEKCLAVVNRLLMDKAEGSRSQQDLDRMICDARDEMALYQDLYVGIREGVEDTVSKLITNRHTLMDEILVRLMEYEMNYYRSAGRYAEEFEPAIDEYREKHPLKDRARLISMTSPVKRSRRSRRSKRTGRSAFSKAARDEQRSAEAEEQKAREDREAMENYDPLHALDHVLEYEYDPAKVPKGGHKIAHLKKDLGRMLLAGKRYPRKPHVSKWGRKKHEEEVEVARRQALEKQELETKLRKQKEKEEREERRKRGEPEPDKQASGPVVIQPDVLPAPAAPAAPAAPGAPPSAPGVPGFPPSAPSVPGFPPSAPGAAPAAPGVPGFPPSAPGAPGAPGAPPAAPPLFGAPAPPCPPGGIPMAPGVPGAPPMAPGMPGVPGAPMAPFNPLLAQAAQLGLSPVPSDKPGVKMTRFHWQPVNLMKVKDSVWEQLLLGESGTDDLGDDKQEEGDTATGGPVSFEAVPFDPEAIEALFAAKTSKGRKSKQQEEDEEERMQEKKKKKEDKVTLIDAKRAYNVMISLSRFKMEPEAIRDAISGFDSEALPLDAADRLLDLFPDKEETKKVQEYKGELDKLGTVEYFFRIMADVPGLKQVLKIFVFNQEFPGLARNVEDNLDVVGQAIDELRHSEGLRVILAVVVRLGNFLNHGTRKGNAYGFELSALDKLRGVKTTDNKSTLLHYLVTYVQKHYPEAQYFCTEVETCLEASRVELQFLQTEIRQMKQNLTLLKAVLTAGDSTDAATTATKLGKVKLNADGITATCQLQPAQREKMVDFCGYAFARYTQIQRHLEQVCEDFDSTAKWFGEADATWEDFFQVWVRFATTWEATVDEIEAAKAEVERQERKRLAAIEQKAERARRQEEAQRAFEAEGEEEEWTDESYSDDEGDEGESFDDEGDDEAGEQGEGAGEADGDNANADDDDDDDERWLHRGGEGEGSTQQNTAPVTRASTTPVKQLQRPQGSTTPSKPGLMARLRAGGKSLGKKKQQPPPPPKGGKKPAPPPNKPKK